MSVARPVLPFAAPALVGRERERAVLAEALGTGASIVLIDGEAGVGKTRFVEDVLPVLAADIGASVWTGRCHPQRDPGWLLPVVDALRDTGPALRGKRLTPIAGAARSLLPELTEVLPLSPDLALLDQPTARHQIMRGVMEIFAALGPAVLVLEDLQWADVATVEFLHYAATQLQTGMHLVATFRRTDLPHSSLLRAMANRASPGVATVRIELEALDVDLVRELIESSLNAAVSADFAEFVHARTGGLPFAVEEILRLLRDRQDLIKLRGQWARRAIASLEVPTAIQDTICERISRLPAAARSVIDAVAVLGPDATLAALARVVGTLEPDEFEEAVVAAVESALLHHASAMRLEFRHALAAEAAYGRLVPAHRRELHRRAGAALAIEGGAASIRLALHARESGDAHWPVLAEQAADDAQAESPASAFELLRDVLATNGPVDPARVRVATKYGRAALVSGLAAEAIEPVADVVNRAIATGEPHGELLFVLGQLRFAVGDIRAAYGDLAGCVDELGAESPTAARALSLLATPLVDQVPMSDHLSWLARAEQAAESLDPAAGIAVKANCVTARVAMGITGGDSAYEAIRSLGDQSCQGATFQVLRDLRVGHRNVAETCCYTGHYATASALLAYSLELPGHGETDIAEEAALRVFLDYVIGHWNGLIVRSEQVDAHSVLGQTQVLLRAAQILTSMRRQRQLLPLTELGALADHARSIGSIPIYLHVSAVLADACLARGGVVEARTTIDEAVQVARAKGGWVWAAELLPAAVSACVAAGEVDAARELVAEAGADLADRHAPAAAAGLVTARGLLADSQADRVSLFTDAKQAWAELPRPYEVARTAMLLGQAMAASGETAAARQCWQQAFEELDRLGANRDLDVVAELLQGLGAVVPASRGPRSGDALSKREREVARLAASGLTNRAIAERLFLSPRTVEHHMERTLRKLGLKARSDLTSMSGSAALNG